MLLACVLCTFQFTLHIHEAEVHTNTTIFFENFLRKAATLLPSLLNTQERELTYIGKIKTTFQVLISLFKSRIKALCLLQIIPYCLTF